MVFGIKKLQDDIFCLTEERDYFQSRYTEQVSIIQALQDELKTAKREIAKLRQELIETTVAASNPPPLVDHVSTLTNDDVMSTLSPPQNSRQLLMSPLTGDGAGRGGIVLATPDVNVPNMNKLPRGRRNGSKAGNENDDDDDASSCLTEDDHVDAVDGGSGKNVPRSLLGDTEQSDDDSDDDSTQEEDDDDGSDDDDDVGGQNATPNADDDGDEDTEAKDIRQSAEKLLQWAQYRTSRRSSATGTPDMMGLSTSSVLSGGSTHTRRSLLSNAGASIAASTGGRSGGLSRQSSRIDECNSFADEKKEEDVGPDRPLGDAARRKSDTDSSKNNLTEQFEQVA